MKIKGLRWSYAPQTLVCNECTLEINRGEKVVFWWESLAPAVLTKEKHRVKHTLCQPCGQFAEDSLTTMHDICSSSEDLIKLQEQTT